MHAMKVQHNPAPDSRKPSPLRTIATVALWATLLGAFAGCRSTNEIWNDTSSRAWWDENGNRVFHGNCGSGSNSQTDLSGLIAAIVHCAF